MSFKVIKAGFNSSIQDRGRFGMAHQGLSQSGVADEHAYYWANHLLGNDVNDAVLEITFGGCELLAMVDIGIVVAGADLSFKINNQSQVNWQVLVVKKGDKLTWSTPKSGVRAYLAAQGGLKTTSYFNSRSINVREKVGAVIHIGDELLCETSNTSNIGKAMPARYMPNYNDSLTLRILPSYQYDQFTEQQRQTLLDQKYRIGSASDRTGYRLEGQPIRNTPCTMVSEGMAYGSVEITSAGMPIILLKDAPTIGGYPKIGTVCSLDLAKLTQRQQGATLQFKLADIDVIQQERVKFNAFFNK